MADPASTPPPQMPDSPAGARPGRGVQRRATRCRPRRRPGWRPAPSWWPPTRGSSRPRPTGGPSTWPWATSTRWIRPPWPRAEAAGARVERHPAAKDATDLELALGVAAASGPARDRGGRRRRRATRPPDGRPAGPDRRRLGRHRGLGPGRAGPGVRRARPPRRCRPQSGELVTLLAVGGPARGDHHPRPALPPGRRDPRARLDPRRQQRAAVDRVHRSTLTDGVLLVILPGPSSGLADPSSPRIRKQSTRDDVRPSSDRAECPCWP